MDGVEKYQVLTTELGGRPKVSSVIEFEEESLFNKSRRWKTLIPDAGSETNAARLVRLLNKEYAENIDQRNKRAAEQEAARQAITQRDVALG